MGRKVFISVLGTGFYDTCKYVKGGFTSSETRFIQQATLEYLKVKEKWTNVNTEGEATDRIIILLTEGSKAANWDKGITTRQKRQSEPEVSYEGLEQVLNDMELPCIVESFHIPDGKTEEEMWSIFNIVYDALEEGDELYFDLTHSFRYLPMLILVLANYAKFLKGVMVKHISYGNYEARNTSTNEAPLMDILPLTILQDWTFAAADLIQNGNIKRFQDLKENNAIIPFLRSRSKKNIDRRLTEEPLGNYIDSLQCYLQDMKLCQGPNILEGTSINSISNNHEQLSTVLQNVIAPIPPIIHRIQESLHGFEKTDKYHPSSLLNGYQAAKWCFDHQLYQQAITILEENVTTHFCRYLGTNESIYIERKASNSYLRSGGFKEADWKDNNDENDRLKEAREKAERAAINVEVGKFVKEMREHAGWIHKKRNSYNHASMVPNDKFTQNDVTRLGEIINHILLLFG